MGDIADMYDHYPDDEYFEVQCKFCGRGGLEWGEITRSDGSLGWALFTATGRRHTCNRAASPDEFAVIDEATGGAA